MVVLDLDGRVVEGALKPSSDTASHLYVYRHRPDVNGVVHTHSRYATAFAAVGRSDPGLPDGPRRRVRRRDPVRRVRPDRRRGDRRARSSRRSVRSPAILLKNHGVFTIGPTAEAAVKAAVMIEDVAATVWAALQIGSARRAPRRRRGAAARPVHHELRPVARPGRRQMPDLSDLRSLVRHRQPAPLRSGDARDRRRAFRGDRGRGARRLAVDPGDGRGQAGRDRLRRDPARCARRPTRATACVGLDHLDAHVLAGQDVDRRPRVPCRSRSSTCTPSTTASIPWAAIDMDFMNLNQAAHGDREFGFIAARMRLERKVVVGHWSDARGPGARRRLVASRLREARLGDRADRPVRRQHARGRGHRGRQGRGATAARVQRQHLRRRRSGRGHRRRDRAGGRSS